jgi:hypothetical protein
LLKIKKDHRLCAGQALGVHETTGLDLTREEIDPAVLVKALGDVDASMVMLITGGTVMVPERLSDAIDECQIIT